jgi:hypothetical protein
MTDKKVRTKSRPKPDVTTQARQSILQAERALQGVGHEKIVMDAEGYGLTAALIAQHGMPKSFVLRKALLTGLRVLQQFGEPQAQSPTQAAIAQTSGYAQGDVALPEPEEAVEEKPDRALSAAVHPFEDAEHNVGKIIAVRPAGQDAVIEALVRNAGFDPIATAVASGE